MTKQEKKELLMENMGKRVFSYNAGYNEIINTNSIIEITELTINKIANRKQAYLYDNQKQLWYEGRQL